MRCVVRKTTPYSSTEESRVKHRRSSSRSFDVCFSLNAPINSVLQVGWDRGRGKNGAIGSNCTATGIPALPPARSPPRAGTAPTPQPLPSKKNVIGVGSSQPTNSVGPRLLWSEIGILFHASSTKQQPREIQEPCGSRQKTGIANRQNVRKSKTGVLEHQL